MKNNLMYDVAISFAGTERDYARAIQEILTTNDIRVFFDELYEAELWGENLIEELGDIYESKAKYCLIIVSEQYVERVYTNLERRSALERAIKSPSAYILPVVTDKAWIKGLPKSTAYMDLRKKSVIGICEAIIKKIQGKNAPNKINIPNSTNIPRLPIGSLSPDELHKYLLELCVQSNYAGVILFGVLVYDERSAEIRHLLLDDKYWDALDIISGPDLEIFAIRDEQKSRYESSGVIEMMTAMSSSRTRGRTKYFSRLLKEYFGEDDTRLSYPSLILFTLETGNIYKCWLIPLSSGTIDSTFDQLRDLFSIIATVINNWREIGDQPVSKLLELLKENLLNEKYTLYIQNTPSSAKEAINNLVSFMDG